MPANVLITGAAGYIGGSLLADFLASNDTLIQKQHFFAAVRSEEQAKALSGLGVKVLQLDLADEKAVIDSLLAHEINIVVHTAGCIDPGLVLPLVTALGKRREIIGEDTYFIHTSGLSGFIEKTGWPQGEFKDTGPVFDTEKQLADSFPVRKTDVDVIEHAKEQGVTSFVVVPPLVYGKGYGAWNQLSVIIPLYVRGTISQKKVHKFAENTKVSGVHVSDLTTLYGLILEKILRNESLPSGTEGYYFALAHKIVWWDLLDQLAVALKARGLISDTTIETWASDKAVAEALGMPEPWVPLLWNSSEDIIPERAFSIGWKPTWNNDRFLQNINDEIEAVIQLGSAKSSLIESFLKAGEGN